MRTRIHKTRWTVRLADRVAAACITVGGIGTILAVTGVFLFLVSVVIPIFRSGHAVPAGHGATAEAAPLYAGVDEYRVCGWSLAHDGSFRSFRLDNGDALYAQLLVPSDSLAGASLDVRSNTLALGRTDGSIRLFRIEWETDYPPASALPASTSLSHAGECATVEDAVIELTAEGSLRRQRAKLVDAGEISVASPATLRAIDHIAEDKGFIVATLAGDSLIVDRLSRSENEFTGEATTSVERHAIATPDVGANARVLVAEEGNSVYVIGESGNTIIVDARTAALPVIATATMARDAPITAATALIGRSTLLLGDAKGNVTAWFTAESNGQRRLVSPRVFRGDGSAVTSIAASSRERLFVVGYADGRVRMFQATSGKRVIDTVLEPKARVDALAFAPKTDGLLVAAGASLRHFNLEPGHPEVTLRSLFRPVWYEGYPAPTHVWQSSAGTDDFEAKLGLWPLVFGTLKATFYAMLFGVPLALLAAVFTSEFVSPSLRPRLKTLIESMASLPSVVLGFLAALVFAPFVQGHVASVMVGFLIVPFTLLSGAYLWQLLPGVTTRRLSRLRFPIVLLLLPVSIALAAVMGPWTERVLFAGDIMSWLDGQRGSGYGGWLLLLIPFCAVAVIIAMNRFTEAWFRRASMTETRSRVAWMDFARFAGGTLATLLLAVAVGGLLTLVHADPRGGFFGTYVQRNALVVGFVMGFAIIPIIYTIAEDALSAVPSHLRAASLGAGATPWQTAMRIVLPTAMSGLFSAIMIGLGRAVGETMIVLMAAGNTPVLQMNAFNGFRTLSANIAVELPEAVRNSTHYRTLFLAAFLLFGMTFIVNTVAEIIRLRFRKRSAQI
jgi:phosphate transport system permease protein